MKPELKKIAQISPDQSVVCIVGKDELPESIKLSKTEKDYVLRKLKEKENHVYINSYFKSTYIIRLKENSSQPRVREELRREASKLKKLIKSNNHSELVITSHKAYDKSTLDFAEGLLLSAYPFDKYLTKDDEKSKTGYPPVIYIHGDAKKEDLLWLSSLTDAVYFTRDLINDY